MTLHAMAQVSVLRQDAHHFGILHHFWQFFAVVSQNRKYR
jgi:hypothetical protein